MDDVDRRHTLARLMLGVALLLGNAAAQARDIDLRIIAFNDFHGHLEAGENTLLVPHPDDAQRRVALRVVGMRHEQRVLAGLEVTVEVVEGDDAQLDIARV